MKRTYKWMKDNPEQAIPIIIILLIILVTLIARL